MSALSQDADVSPTPKVGVSAQNDQIESSPTRVPVQVARAHRHISAGGFDLPELAETFDGYAREHGVAERVRFWPGDFFRDDLPCADVLAFGRVLHNWD